MSLSLLPTFQIPGVEALSPEMLQKLGVRLLMLDFDNTIVPYTTKTPTPAVDAWLRAMAASPISLCIVSNSHSSRVPTFCERYGIACILHAHKPWQRGIRRCLSQFGASPSQAALVGDQIFTDTLGGNCAGVRTILVRPIHNHNIWLKLRHILELPMIWISRKRRILL
ncbi:MAG: YqeG family HAD IIIA-type phosphatase [Firmicutes bacterium]|nr:YqeG family HAD IIIA-type phosphatase [Bacillota bacterium]